MDSTSFSTLQTQRYIEIFENLEFVQARSV